MMRGKGTEAEDSMGKGAFTNRAGRRSGGAKPVKILVGLPEKELPALSFQCFESRHGECGGGIGLWASTGERCECKCHGKRK